jgi:hypothetical protein
VLIDGGAHLLYITDETADPWSQFSVNIFGGGVGKKHAKGVAFYYTVSCVAQYQQDHTVLLFQMIKN